MLSIPKWLFCGLSLCIPASQLPAAEGEFLRTISIENVFAEDTGEFSSSEDVNPLEDSFSNEDAKIALDPAASEVVQSSGSNSPVYFRTSANGSNWSPADSLELFAGLEGSKQPQDFGVNAHFGARLHANWGFPLVEEWGLGGQIGTGVDMTDNAVRVTGPLTGVKDQTQSFTTVGIFQRKDGFTWGLVYDFLAEDAYDQFFLTQFRGRAGYAFNPQNEIGVYGILPNIGDSGNWGGTPVNLRSIAQGSVYWRHTWQSSAETSVWLGVADSHGQRNVALGGNSPTGPVILFGSDLHVPLNNYIALFGEANFISPADTGTVDAYLGFAVYPHGNARNWRKRNYSPVMPVADNTSFSVDLR